MITSVLLILYIYLFVIIHTLGFVRIGEIGVVAFIFILLFTCPVLNILVLSCILIALINRIVRKTL